MSRPVAPGVHHTRTALGAPPFATDPQVRCNPTNADLFGETNDRGQTRQRRTDAARAVCWTCPLRRPCAEWAIATRQPHGVYGALTADERRTLTEQRDAA